MPTYHIVKSEEVRTEYFIEAKDEAHAKRKALKGREKFAERAKVKPRLVFIEEIKRESRPL
jgi:hypothetical protein